MVRIRLRRVGAKHQASYRIVVTEKESARDGRFLEILGHYNPRTHPSSVEIDESRLFHWLKNGASPSESAKKLLTEMGAWGRWERYKAGEALETLQAEAEAGSRSVDQRTRMAQGSGRGVSKKIRTEAAEGSEAAKQVLPGT